MGAAQKSRAHKRPAEEGSPGRHPGEVSTEEDMKAMERRRKKRNAAYIFPARGLPPPPEAVPG